MTVKIKKQQLNILRIVWTISIFWGEYYDFHRTISDCEWPKNKNNEEFHVLIIADPQLPSIEYSYPERPWLLRWFSIQIIDQFIRKSFRLIIKIRNPDAIVFLGDLLDGGITTTDPIKFQKYVKRFNHTFPLTNQHRDNLIHLVGNHDVGLFPSTTKIQSTLARQRFMQNWKPHLLNGHLQWANHTMIWIDSLALIEEFKFKSSGLSNEAGEVTKFINGLSGPDMLLPKILFTHVPLWRPQGTSCGPLREHVKVISQGSGVNYQNEIPYEPTKLILEKIQPSLVFSGDDHDYCSIIHTLPSNSLANPSPLKIPEISVKSFSMGMGIHNPGYQLLTLSNPNKYATTPSEITSFHQDCILPDQIRIYTHVYLPLLGVSLVVIFGGVLGKWMRRCWWSGKSRKSANRRQRQARSNGLPLHHNRNRSTNRHRKSLSITRTLMFTKKPKPGTTISSTSSSSSSSSSLSSSSEVDERSKEESSRFIHHRSRRSGSLGVGKGNIGLGIDHNGHGFNSTNNASLSYHSPLDSSHEEQRLFSSTPTPIINHNHSHLRKSLETGRSGHEFPPTHHLGRTLSSRFHPNLNSSSSSLPPNTSSSSTPRFPHNVLRSVLGTHLTQKLAAFFSGTDHASGREDEHHLRSRARSSKRLKSGSLSTSFQNLVSLLWLIGVVYGLVWVWFTF
ncbi:hypothetical protein Pst134EA_011061 [Puccinia striiformis f. sp. tritici]|uniref:hypothetical protein n=1 Tax=Puccinia striiformis f. sp. tritici TaxID=168172 RepID=UPI00200738D1|nr:hypothetical protein Pst134EA_011061 [Puccinia striiformis f. sp. tritici]KAH9467415.1 hypothetical protein Pst134EA_011061 [Puccinia striiformis f. sp. tritici]